jgi:hypothetical protein
MWVVSSKEYTMCYDLVQPLQVSRRQFAVIMEKQDSGEDIHVYTLQSVLSNNSMGQASSNALRDHWLPIDPFSHTAAYT